LFLTDLPTAEAQGTTEENSTISYPASYFAEYSPLTVNDMLDRVPGISLIIDQDNSNFEPDARGLGASSQILIDGKRMAGKANEARSQLDRISADQVRSIEIVRGTSSDLDVQNTGQLVNIVLLESQSRSSVTTEFSATHFSDGEVEPGGSLAWSGQNGRLSYLLSGGLQTGYSHNESFERSFNGDFSANDIREEDRYSDQKTYSLNSNLAYSINDRDRIAFNLLYNKSDPPQSLNRTSTDLNSLVPVVTQERESTAATSSEWEFGGDYEHGLQNGNKFKLLFIINEEETHRTRERFSSSEFIGVEAKDLFLDTSNRYQEKIVRGSYTLNLSGNQGLELGMEAAQTDRKSVV
jgi:outer membrane receptor for ferrienterochelin and colicin